MGGDFTGRRHGKNAYHSSCRGKNRGTFFAFPCLFDDQRGAALLSRNRKGGRKADPKSPKLQWRGKVLMEERAYTHDRKGAIPDNTS